MEKKDWGSEQNRNYRLWQKYIAFQATKRISQREFAERNGFDSAGTVSQFLHGQRPLRIDSALQFCKGLNCSLSEILDPESIRIIQESYKALNDIPTEPMTNRKVVKTYSFEQALYVASGAVGVPLGTIPSDYEESRKVIGLHIQSEDMAPEFVPGDTVIVDLKAVPRPGNFVLVAVPSRTKALLREYFVRSVSSSGQDAYELRAKDEHFPSFSSENGVKILGVVVEKRSKYA